MRVGAVISCNLLKLKSMVKKKKKSGSITRVGWFLYYYFLMVHASDSIQMKQIGFTPSKLVILVRNVICKEILNYA